MTTNYKRNKFSVGLYGDTDDLTDPKKCPEATMWYAKIYLHLQDFIFPFSVDFDNRPPLEDQYKKFKAAVLEGKPYTDRCYADRMRGRRFLESDDLEWVALDLLGEDEYYVQEIRSIAKQCYDWHNELVALWKKINDVQQDMFD